MSALGLVYLLLIVSMLAADFQFANWDDLRSQLNDPRVRYSINLSLISCTISAILALWVAVPTGYLLARLDMRLERKGAAARTGLQRNTKLPAAIGRISLRWGRHLVDALLDVPIFLPPIVVGISLLLLFQTAGGQLLEQVFGRGFAWLGWDGLRGITYEIPAVILAQFTVATAFAIRTMRDTFAQIDQRPEQIATTLGGSHLSAFADVALPQAWRGVIAAFTLAWARSLGEFGPILIFAGTTRMKTEVLSTTVYLSFQSGDLPGAISASLILLTLAMLVLLMTRWFALGGIGGRA